MKKKLLIIIFIFAFCFPVLAETYESSYSIYLNGGKTYRGKDGNESDYVPGVNSFPVVPAHSNLIFGASFQIKLYRSFDLELGVKNTFSKTVTLVDPGDNDELSYQTLSYYQTYLSLTLKRVLSLHVYGVYGSRILT